MLLIEKQPKRLLVASALLLLAACGGGGSSPDGGAASGQNLSGGSSGSSGADSGGSGGDSGIDPANAPTADNSGSIQTRKPVTNYTEHDSSKPLNFIIVGDAGTAATGAEPGNTQQEALALVMAQVCEAKKTNDNPGCHFGLAAGDNIYFAGATSTYDSNFETAFEDIYNEVNIPFYLVLGNHDNGFAGQLGTNGDFQVEYSYRTDRQSENFNMPGRYYTHRWGGVMELFAVDSDTIDSDLGGLATADAAYDDQFQRQWLRDAIKNPQRAGVFQ